MRIYYISLAIRTLLKKTRICIENVRGALMGFYKGVTLLTTARGILTSDGYLTSAETLCHNDITDAITEAMTRLLPRTPVFIVDLSLWELHHEKERQSLIKQLAVTINTVRRWLADFNLMIVSAPLSVRQKLQELVPNFVIFHNTPDIYRSLNADNAVVLDPYADEELSEADVYKYDYFILGGVIDRLYPRPYATFLIYTVHNLNFKRKAVKLRGSAVGVPNELNKIIDIILHTRIAGIALEEAIKINMDIDDKLVRIFQEVVKLANSGLRPGLEDVLKLVKEYNLDEDYVPRVMSFIRKLKSCLGEVHTS
uniref:SAM-dependent MTase TRM10-type domain-containing protein n=1 Tax=Ignisphaera aggregans TaxID=334771 RepID=A0A7C2ZL38_9CREN